MTTLALVRHAKSDWGDPGLDDHDRPLNERGMRDAPAAAQRLVESGFAADAVLASTALRARTTAQFFADALGVELERREELYGASARTLLATAVARAVPRVVIVAHDPGMTVLAGALSGERIAHMPTCAVATFHWDSDDWEVASSVDPDRWSFDAPRSRPR